MHTATDHTRSDRRTRTGRGITTVELTAYPGWCVRYNHSDRVYWAFQRDGLGIGPGERTFADAVRYARTAR